jgi:hypothetical protein
MVGLVFDDETTGMLISFLALNRIGTVSKFAVLKRVGFTSVM